MTWAAGVSGNKAGRPKGAKNLRTREMFERLALRGDKDPAEYLSEVISNGADPQLKIQAAAALLPYKYAKQASEPFRRFIETPIDVPEFTTIPDAENFLAHIAQLVAKGELDIDRGKDLAQLVTTWINSKYARDELNLKIANSTNSGQDQVIRIEGGLPTMPGLENLVMPQIGAPAGAPLNGHSAPLPPAIDHCPPTPTDHLQTDQSSLQPPGSSLQPTLTEPTDQPPHHEPPLLAGDQPPATDQPAIDASQASPGAASPGANGGNPTPTIGPEGGSQP